MKINNLMVVIIGGAIAVLMVGTLLIPFVADYTDSTKEYYNNSSGNYAIINDGSNIDFSIVPTGNTSGTIHNVVIDGENIASISTGIRSIVMSDKFVISQTNGRLLAFGYVIDGVKYSLSFESGATLTVSLSNNVATVSNGTDTYTIPFDWCFYRDNSSTSYKMIDYLNSDRTVYINDVNQVYASNLINTTGEFFVLNGTNVTIYGENENTTASYDGLTEVMNGVSSFTVGPITDGVRTTGIHFTVLNDGADYEVYPYFIVVPASVYGVSESNTVINSMFAILPILVIAGIVSTISYMVISRK